MANLFFVHTPMQLLFAQQIVKQEQFLDNYILFGYVSNNEQFCKVYELLAFDGIWKEWIPMPKIATWADVSRKHLFRDCRKTLCCWHKILSVVKEYQIDRVFLGDIKNYSYHLAAMALNKKQIKICFFEEGSGHYIMNYEYGQRGVFIDRVYAILIDSFFYRPFFHVPFGYIHYSKGFELNDLPIDIRYSIIPFYHDVFDRQLHVTSLLSSNVQHFLSTELSSVNTLSNHILLLTSPIYELYDNNYDLYVETIIDYLSSINDQSTHLYIKFHQRERDDVRSIIVEELKKKRTHFSILGETINVPVELYLQYVKFDRIVIFFCSTAIYNGYLFPKTSFQSLLYLYRKKCESHRRGCVNLIRFLEDESLNLLKKSFYSPDDIKSFFIK